MFKSEGAKTITQYLAAMDEPRKSQIKKVHETIKKAVPGLKPSMQSGMIGYGTYHYRYESGREGDCPVIGLASNKSYISVYVMGTLGGRYVAEMHRDKLPKASIGKSCIRFRKVEDIDLAVLSKVVKEGARALQTMARA